jgi:hypothetical protein
VVNRAGEIFVDGRGAVCEGFVGRAVACADAALAAFSGAFIILETEMAIAPVFVGALRARPGQPVVILAAVVAPFANRHMVGSVAQLWRLSKYRADGLMPASCNAVRAGDGFGNWVWGELGDRFAKRRRRICKAEGRRGGRQICKAEIRWGRAVERRFGDWFSGSLGDRMLVFCGERGSGVRVGERMIVLSPAGSRAYWFSFSFFWIALIALPISWTWDESMANKLLMRWSSAFTHSAFSSAFFSCQSLCRDGFSQCFVSDILDIFS